MATARGREPIPAVWKSSPYGVELIPLDVPSPTQVSLGAGEPIRACAIGDSVRVYAPLTLATADGRVNLTQPFTFNPYGDSMGVAGVNLESGDGSIFFQNNVDWRDARVEGALEVGQWDAFTDRLAAYPVLEWCRGWQCVPETE